MAINKQSLFQKLSDGLNQRKQGFYADSKVSKTSVCIKSIQGLAGKMNFDDFNAESSENAN